MMLSFMSSSKQKNVTLFQLISFSISFSDSVMMFDTYAKSELSLTEFHFISPEIALSICLILLTLTTLKEVMMFLKYVDAIDIHFSFLHSDDNCWLWNLAESDPVNGLDTLEFRLLVSRKLSLNLTLIKELLVPLC